jgi:hypothetical protein
VALLGIEERGQRAVEGLDRVVESSVIARGICHHAASLHPPIAAGGGHFRTALYPGRHVV